MKVSVQGMLPFKTLKSFREKGKQWRPEMKDTNAEDLTGCINMLKTEPDEKAD